MTWNRPDEYAFMTAERMTGFEGMGISPGGEFPFVGGGGTRNAGSADALTRWAQATAQHHSVAPWEPHYAPMPAGYQAPFADGLFGVSAPAALTRGGGPSGGGMRRVGFGLLGAWMLFMAYKGRKAKKESMVIGAVGAGLLYTAWRS